MAHGLVGDSCKSETTLMAGRQRDEVRTVMPDARSKMDDRSI